MGGLSLLFPFYHSPIHSAWATAVLGSMVYSTLNLSGSHKWGIEHSSLHTSFPKMEQFPTVPEHAHLQAGRLGQS